MISRPLRLLSVILLLAPPLPGQTRRVGGRSEVFAGSELDNYLRVLQVVGAVPSYPWSVRAFGESELDRVMPKDTLHPWAPRYDWRSDRSTGRLVDIIWPTASVRFNTAYPYGWNDGAIWAGRGLTTAFQIGVALRRGPLTITIAPLAFRAENDGFALEQNGDTGRLAFADGVFPGVIDRPQRFGAQPYTALDPGESAARLDLRGVALGFGTAHEWWGPSLQLPIILGNNAAGFLHAFLGTARPIDLRAVRIHGRVVWGQLSQSPYSAATGPASRRFAAGVVGVLTTRWVPGLELGVSRFSHSLWPAGGPTLGDLIIPFTSNFASNNAGNSDNQLASAFLRWVFPASGVELWGEYGREDYGLNVRDLVLEPDHDAGYTLGFRKALSRAPLDLWFIRIELQNLQISQLTLARGQTPFYIHGIVTQGHTQRGKILGSPAGVGGAASVLAVDRYHPGGRWTLFLSRELRQDRGQFVQTGTLDPRALDVQLAAGANGLFFRGPYDVTAGVTAVYELNRDFQRDVMNLNFTVAVRAAR